MSRLMYPQAVEDVKQIKNTQDSPTTKILAELCSAQCSSVVAELVSTMMLILFGCMSCIPINGLTESPLYTPLIFGATVLLNIQIFGEISGAHMNPAVTIAAVIWGSTSIATGIAFSIAQTLGAVIGYGILILLSPVDLALEGVCVTRPQLALNEFQAFGVEVVLTATLVFVCCGLWDPMNKNKPDSASIKSGLTVVGLSVMGGPLTGASMNPARTLAPALFTGIWKSHWVYWAGPVTGAVFTTVLYKKVFLYKTYLPK